MLYAESSYPGSKPGFQDSFRILFNNLLQFILGNDSEDGAEVASPGTGRELWNGRVPRRFWGVSRPATYRRW